MNYFPIIKKFGRLIYHFNRFNLIMSHRKSQLDWNLSFMSAN
jgi:hypothetical protein